MDGAAAQPPAHIRLREHTRAAHEAAEATAGMHALMSGAMDEAGYHTLLAAQLNLFRAWEAERAADIAAVAGIWPYPSRVPPLEADLPVGARLRATSFASTQRPPGSVAKDVAHRVGSHNMDTAGHPGRAAFWGELYVIEGSTLGGRVIVRHLRSRFPTLSHRFYAMGEQAPGDWRRFQRVLDDALADDARQQIAIDGAQQMFARFQRTLQDPGHHV